MSAKPTKLYPIKGRWVHDAPAAVHVVETKAEAEGLIESGAFTDNPNHPDRDHDAQDLTAPAPEAPLEPASQAAQAAKAAEAEGEAATAPDPDAPVTPDAPAEGASPS